MSNGQTVIQYGDGTNDTVYLFRCQTGTVQQRPNFDSGRSVTSWKFIVSGIGYVHGLGFGCKYSQVVPLNPDASPNVSPPTSASMADQQARWRLRPRQKFVMAVGCTSPSSTPSTVVASGRPLLEANPMTSVSGPRGGLPNGLTGYDVDDGPRCLQFDIIHMAADNIYKVAYTFEVNLVLCTDDSKSAGNTNGVLSNRWSVTDSWDHNKRTIRTYSGSLELATSQFSPHWFRYLVVPPLQPGMRRDYGVFTATEDGKHLQYTITDTEIAIACPAPANKWKIDHTETAVANDGLKVQSSCEVVLEGSSDCDVGQLIYLGLYVVSSKLAGVAPGGLVNGVIMMNDISIKQFTGDVNAVVVSASCWRPAVDLVGLATRAEGFNKMITAADLPPFAFNYDPLLSTDARLGEFTEVQGPTALAGIFRCYLQTSCANVAGIAASQAGDINLSPDSFPKEPTAIRIVPTLTTTDVPYYSGSQNTNTYFKWQGESVYKKKSMRVAMPIALGPGSTPDLRNSVVTPQITSPVMYRVVRILGTRIGDYPQFPDAETMDGGYSTGYGGYYPPIPQILLKTNLLGRTESIAANGTPLYHAEFEAIYVLARSPQPNELLKLGQNKWELSSGTLTTPTLTNSSYP